MRYVINPMSGSGEILFGMTVGNVRRNMSGEFRTFDRHSGMGVTDKKCMTDAYHGQGVHFLYDPDGKLEAISFFLPARPLLDGVDILNLRMSEATAFLKRLDPALIVENGSAISSHFSLGVIESSEADDDEDAPIESFFFGRAGYYT